MRAAPVLVTLALAAVGCQTAQPTDYREPIDQPASALAYVTLPRLAEELDLNYVGEGDGMLELSTPPDNVLLVLDSRRALVNGQHVAMNSPCVRRGSDVVLTTHDAAKVRQLLADLRAARYQTTLESIPEPPTPTRRVKSSLIPSIQPRVPARHWRYIVIHHAVVEEGSASLLDLIHRRRGYDGLGYHFVIGNGTGTRDGEVEIGYRWRDQVHGAHARAKAGDDNKWNRQGIGICLMGDFTKEAPSPQQLDTLVALVRHLREVYDIPFENVVPHRFVTPTICPGPKFPWAEFQRRIRD